MGTPVAKLDQYGTLNAGVPLLKDSLSIIPPSDSNVKLLLHGEGYDAETVADDSSGNGHAVTFNGGCALSSEHSFFDFHTCFKLLSASSQYLSITDHADFNLGSNDFTLSCRVLFNSIGASNTFISQWGTPGPSEKAFYIGYAGTNLEFDWSVDGAITLNTTYAWTPEVGRTYEIMVTRSSNTGYLFIDGTMVKSFDLTGVTIYDSSEDVRVGASRGGAGIGEFLDGYIGEVYINNGTALYTASYDLPTEPYEGNIGHRFTLRGAKHTKEYPGTNTKLLIHGQGYDDGIVFDDSSIYNRLITAGGSVKTTENIRHLSDQISTMYFNGSTDYLELEDSVDWNVVGSALDNWTIDLKVQHLTAGTQQDYIIHFEDVNNYWRLERQADNTVIFLVWSGGVNILSLLGGSISDTDEHHIAVCKIADEYGLYIDGVQVAYTQDSSTDTFTGSLFIGQKGNSSLYFHGYMSGVRIANENAFSASPNVGLSDTITPPTSMYTGNIGHLIGYDFLNNINNQSMNLITKAVAGSASSVNVNAIFNDDTGANYGDQYHKGVNTTPSGLRATAQSAMLLGTLAGSAQIAFSNLEIDALSTSIRIAVATQLHQATGTTVNTIDNRAFVWNSASTILSIDVFSTVANLFDEYSTLHLFSTPIDNTGMPTGDLDIYGDANCGVMQSLNQVDIIPNSSSNVKLLLHGEGFDGDTRLYDASQSAHAVTFNGSAALSNEHSFFNYHTSFKLAQSTSDYLSITDHADFDLGSNNFTISCRLCANSWLSNPAKNNCFITQHDSSGNDIAWFFSYDPGGNLQFSYSTDGTIGGTTYQQYAWTPETGRTYEVMVTRSGNTGYMFIDGTMVKSFDMTGITIHNSSDDIRIGALKTASPDYFFDGYIGEVYINKGTALYTASYDLSTEPYEGNIGHRIDLRGKSETKVYPDSDVNLLIHGAGWNGEQVVDDSSMYNHLISVSGTVTTDISTAPISLPSSISFDGSTGYLSIPQSTNWNVVASAVDSWTVELFAKHSDHVGTEVYITQFEDGNNFWDLFHVHGSGIRFNVTSGGVSILATSYAGEITDTDWHHIMVVKVADEYGVYVDGAQVSYTQDSSTDTFVGSLFLGQIQSANFFDGNMASVKITNGNPYSATPVVGLSDTVTIPTAPLTGNIGHRLGYAELAGDTDELYNIATRIVAGGNGDIQININELYTSIYGYQQVKAQNTTDTAARGSVAYLVGVNTTATYLSTINMIGHAISGTERPFLSRNADRINGTTVDAQYQMGQLINNTTDEIKQITFKGISAAYFDEGSSVRLSGLKRRVND